MEAPGEKLLEAARLAGAVGTAGLRGRHQHRAGRPLRPRAHVHTSVCVWA